MKISRFPDYPALCEAVAQEVQGQLQLKPESVLVFPTGNTPLGLFKVLVEKREYGFADFSRCHVVALDEYDGLAPGDRRSLAGWLKRELLDPVGISPERVHGFDEGVDAIEDTINRLGGLDLVVLGLGPNGHLGFNEPGSAFDSRSRRITLTPESIASNAAYWGSEAQVPRNGFTLGLDTIAEARSIILMVSGAGKTEIVSEVLSGPVSVNNPATVLRQISHARLFVDAAAHGSRL